MEKYQYKVIRTEYHIAKIQVDQYGMAIKSEVLSKYPNRDLAVSDLDRFARPHPHVLGRMIPIGNNNGYEHIAILRKEVEVAVYMA